MSVRETIRKNAVKDAIIGAGRSSRGFQFGFAEPSLIEWDHQHGGLAGSEHGGDPLPEAILAGIRRTRLALKGPLTTPVGGGFRPVNVGLAEAFPGGRFEDIDLVLVRENIEGPCVAVEHYIAIGDDPHAVAISSGMDRRAVLFQ